MKSNIISQNVAVPATNFNYGIDVLPMLPSFPNAACYWLGFQWQPGIGRWMAHVGRRNRFCLVTPQVLKFLVREARRKELVVAAYLAKKD